jgi:hypothetical protein
MFSVKTQLFSNVEPHEVGRLPLLADARAFADTRVQFALEMWIEHDGVVVVDPKQLRRRSTRPSQTEPLLSRPAP